MTYKLLSVVLMFSLFGWFRRHPAITALVIGGGAGTAIALSTRQTCAKTYDGKPYYGTAPCPR